MKEILLTIKFEPQHFKEFIDYCRNIFEDNKDELVNVNRFEQKYRDKTPIWWYTYECFLYPMLNRALRMSDVDIIIKMGFFIGDLHRHIEELHKEQFGGHQNGKVFTVYRGQGLSKANFEQMKETKGGLMSFNNFLSTSKNRTVSLGFAHNALTDPDSVGILFVMTIDPSKSTTPFASINGVSYFEDKEDEVLFSMHTVFRINDIKSMGENKRLIQVDLTLTGENDDKDLGKLTDRIRGETYPNEEGWYRLATVLLKLGQPMKAEQVYQVLLEQTTHEIKKGDIYCLLGRAKWSGGEYEEAITFHEKSLEMYKRSLPPNDIHLAVSYANIGVVYYHLGEYSKALSSHERALEIQQQSLPSNHPDLAQSYNNIGLVYDIMSEYSKALSSYEKALEIQQQSLPSNHPDLAASYNNIGNVYNNMGEYSKAISYYEKALEIWQQSLPSHHPHLALSYDNIGLAYEKMGDYAKARSFYERAVDIAQRSLPSNHPNLKKWRNNLDRIKKKL